LPELFAILVAPVEDGFTSGARLNSQAWHRPFVSPCICVPKPTALSIVPWRDLRAMSHRPGTFVHRSSSRHRRLTVASLGRAYGSSGFHPQAAWPGRKVHQCECYGSDRVADRPSALHAEAPSRRGWGTRLAPPVRTGETLPDRWTPEPLIASAPSPEFPSELVIRAWKERESQPFPDHRACIRSWCSAPRSERRHFRPPASSRMPRDGSCNKS